MCSMIFLGKLISQRYCFYSWKDKGVVYKREIPTIPKYAWVFFLLFAFFAGVRYDVGVDHLHYIETYIYGQDWGNRYEFLFRSLEDICKTLGLSYPIFFFVLALLQISLYFLAFKKDVYIYPFLVLFFFCNGEWLNFNNIIRCMLAGCVWLYSLKYIQTKQIWRYLIGVLIAVLFHKSAVILIACYPLLKDKKDWFKSIPLQLCLFGVVFLISKVLFNYIFLFENLINQYGALLGYSFYNLDTLIGSVGENKGSGLGFLLKICINIMIVLSSNNMKKFYRFNHEFIMIYNLYFVGAILLTYIFPVGVISLSRPFRYFYLFQNIMLAYYAYYLLKSNNKGNRLILYGLIASFVVIFYWSIISGTPDSHSWYQFCFEYM